MTDAVSCGRADCTNGRMMMGRESDMGRMMRVTKRPFADYLANHAPGRCEADHTTDQWVTSLLVVVAVLWVLGALVGGAHGC